MNDRSLDGWGVVEKAVELARRGEDFVLATVVWRQGPSSGQHGSRAIVTASGELHGWIGGACAEPVLIREATRALADRQPRLLLLGMPEQLGEVPEGMTHIAISCQSEGALQIYIEPVQGAPHLVVVGRSPMAQTLCQLAKDLDWRAEVIDGSEFSVADIDARAIVVVATQGHGDEEVMEQVIAGGPAYVGLVASRRRGEAVLGYLADRGVSQRVLERVRVPAGLDLGHTTHREVAVAVLAELVQLRAAGAFAPNHATEVTTHPIASDSSQAIDPVCGMTVAADRTSRPFEYNGVNYFFCCPGCRDAFAKDPIAHLSKEAKC
ncbi:MAG: XdhC family protein [Ilumatobacteraceae bacterium]